MVRQGRWSYYTSSSNDMSPPPFFQPWPTRKCNKTELWVLLGSTGVFNLSCMYQCPFALSAHCCREVVYSSLPLQSGVKKTSEGTLRAKVEELPWDGETFQYFLHHIVHSKQRWKANNAYRESSQWNYLVAAFLGRLSISMKPTG